MLTPALTHVAANLVATLAGHGVEGRTVLEPLDLGLVEGVVELDVEGLAILGVDAESHGLADLELGAEQVNLVVGLDLVIVGRLSEGQGKHTLLLKVGLVDTGEAASDDSKTTKVSRLQSSVLTRATLTVVPVTNDNPLDATSLVVTGSSRDSVVFTSESVLDLVSLTVLGVDGTNEHVVGDVVKMATVLQPWASHGDVVSGGLALALDEDRDVSSILAIPGLESLEDLETVTGRGDSDVDSGTVDRRGLVGVTAGVVALSGETLAGGRLELELLAILVLQGIGERVELEGTGNSHGNNKVGGGDEGVSGGVGVVTASEVTVVGGDDGVGLALLDILTVPLSNARTASVGKDDTTVLLEGLQLTVTLDSSANLLRTRGNGEERLGLQAVIEGIPGDRGGTGHVLIGGVGARADKTDLELLRPLVGLDSLLELGDGGSKIGSEGTVDVRLQLRQVDLNQLVILGTLIFAKLLLVGPGEVANVLTLSGLQVVVHAVIVGEKRGSSTNFSTHVTDGTHTSARKRVDTRSVVLNDSTSTTLDSEEASDLKDDIYIQSISFLPLHLQEITVVQLTLRSGPSGQLTSELDTNDLRSLKFPGETSHHIDGISTTDTNGSHTETTAVRSVRVGTDHQTTGESVILQNDLVDDTGARLPETNVVLGSSGGKKVVDLLVDLIGTSQILFTSNLSLNQVVTVDGGRGSDGRHASRHELKDGHLGGGILASNTVGAELQVGNTTLDILLMRVVKVRVEDLLGVRKRTAQTLANDFQVLRHLPIKLAHMLATASMDHDGAFIKQELLL